MTAPLVTKAYRTFREEHRGIHGFYEFVNEASVAWDESKDHQSAVADALEDIFGSAEEAGKDKSKRSLFEEIFRPTYRFKTYKQPLLRMVHCTAVNNYLTYLGELAITIYRKYPQKLPPNRKMNFKQIGSHTEMIDLIYTMALETVSAKLHTGARKLNEYFEEDFGVQLFSEEDQLDRFAIAVAVRNIITHNYSICNRRFLDGLRGVPEDLFPSWARLEDKVELKVRRVEKLLRFLDGAVSELDTRAIKKLKLPAEPDPYILPVPLI